MHFLRPLSILATIVTAVKAQDALVPPTMTLLYSMKAELGERISMGPVPNGQQRIVIPIVGGTFQGPRISGQGHAIFTTLQASNRRTGKVLNIGADWLLVDTRGNARPNTRYNIQADDGTYIYVQTEGPTLNDGRILLHGTFDTATTGTDAWMQDVVAVGVLNVNGTNEVLIDMWQASP
jgi:hypothetical protein